MTSPYQCCVCEMPIHPDELVDMEDPFTGHPAKACRCCKEDAEREADAAYMEQEQAYNAGIDASLTRYRDR